MLRLLTELQTLSAEGGWVLWGLVALAFGIAFSLVSIWRGIQLEDSPILPSDHWLALLNNTGQDRDDLVQLRDHLGQDQLLPDRLDELDQRLFARPARRLVFAFVLVTAAPLIGLLGTVTGMLATFSGMSGDGTAPPIDIISGGVSQALITTQAGLILGVPTFIICALLRGRLNKLRLSYQRLAAKLTSEAAQ